jgi:hypothetical protein
MTAGISFGTSAKLRSLADDFDLSSFEHLLDRVSLTVMGCDLPLFSGSEVKCFTTGEPYL